MNRPLILPALRRTADDAERFARVVHAGQVDKAGRPYVEHLERVASRARDCARRVGVRSEIDWVTQIAWLHDVIEDTIYRADHLFAEGFTADVVRGVQLLTKAEGGWFPGVERVSYADWIDSLCKNAPLPVLIVKLADIEDNSDPARLAALDEATRIRLERKYGPARDRLRAAIGGEGDG